MADAYRVVEGGSSGPGHGGAPPRRRFGVRGGRVWIVATAALLLVAVVASTAVLTFRTAKVPPSRSTDDSWVDSLAALSRGRGTVIHASGGSHSGSGSEARARTSHAPPSIGFVAVGDWGRDDDDARASAATVRSVVCVRTLGVGRVSVTNMCPLGANVHSWLLQPQPWKRISRWASATTSTRQYRRLCVHVRVYDATLVHT